MKQELAELPFQLLDLVSGGGNGMMGSGAGTEDIRETDQKSPAMPGNR